MCITSYSRGFLIGCEDGRIYTYERVEDPNNPYKKVKEKSDNKDKAD